MIYNYLDNCSISYYKPPSTKIGTNNTLLKCSCSKEELLKVIPFSDKMQKCSELNKDFLLNLEETKKDLYEVKKL